MAAPPEEVDEEQREDERGEDEKKQHQIKATAAGAGASAQESVNAALLALGSTFIPSLDDYRIHEQDMLYVEVFGEADISRRYKVSSQGEINHPLLQKVRLSGLTLEEAEALLTERLKKDFLVDPRVSVRVERSTARRVFIFGEVKKPGTYDVPPDQPMSLLRLFSLAGGFTELAAITRVLVVSQVDGSERTLKVNVSDILRGRGAVRDIPLRPGDIVTVPQTIF
jgi:polysaccharide export outer membrane protein